MSDYLLAATHLWASPEQGEWPSLFIAVSPALHSRHLITGPRMIEGLNECIGPDRAPSCAVVFEGLLLWGKEDPSPYRVPELAKAIWMLLSSVLSQRILEGGTESGASSGPRIWGARGRGAPLPFQLSGHPPIKSSSLSSAPFLPSVSPESRLKVLSVSPPWTWCSSLEHCLSVIYLGVCSQNTVRAGHILFVFVTPCAGYRY